MNFIERRIAGKVIRALIKAGAKITVDYNEGEPELVDSTDVKAIMKAADAVDECWFLVKQNENGGYNSFVYFIWGNGNGGWDCVSDYGLSLEPILEPVFQWIEKESR